MENQKPQKGFIRGLGWIIKATLSILIFIQYILCIGQCTVDESNLRRYYSSAIPVVDASMHKQQLQEVGMSVEEANAVLNMDDTREIAIDIAVDKINVLLGRSESFKTSLNSAQIRLQGIIDRQVVENGKKQQNRSEKQTILLLEISGIASSIPVHEQTYRITQYSTIYGTTITPAIANETASNLSVLFSIKTNLMYISVSCLFVVFIFLLNRKRTIDFCKSIGQILTSTSIVALALMICSLRVNTHSVLTYGLTFGIILAIIIIILGMLIQFFIPHARVKKQKERLAQQLYKQYTANKKETS